MRKNTITFDNGNHAVVVIAGRDTDAQTILKPLGIVQPHALIMVFGGAKGLEDSQKARLAELFTSAVAPAAAEAGALVIDGGTQSGVMAMMGEALARDGRNSQLLGIAPIGKVTYPGVPTMRTSEVARRSNRITPISCWWKAMNGATKPAQCSSSRGL